jgi:hypothetical protein
MRGVRALLLVLAALLLVGCGSSASVSTRRATATTSRPRPTAASADPYTASLAYARCMRNHGVPHPNPDRKGDFHLTPAQERRMKTVPHAQREAAAKACFHTLKGLDMRPLSREAQRRALAVLAEVKRCLARRGHIVGKPIVKPMRMGRWLFGFDRAPGDSGSARDQQACERSTHLAARLDRIIADDRAGY